MLNSKYYPFFKYNTYYKLSEILITFFGNLLYFIGIFTDSKNLQIIIDLLIQTNILYFFEYLKTRKFIIHNIFKKGIIVRILQ